MSKIRSIVAAQSSVGEPEHRGDERSEAARSGGSPTFEPDVVPVVPDSEVPARHARRRFTTAYKLDILRRADACGGHGELGQLLRAEGLCSSHLGTWRPTEAGLMPKNRRRQVRSSRARAGEPSVDVATAPGGSLARIPKKSFRAPTDPPETFVSVRLMIAVDDADAHTGCPPACRVLGLSRASRIGGVNARRPLDPVERQSVLDRSTRASSIRRRRRCTPRCSMRGPTSVRRARCIASSTLRTSKERRNQVRRHYVAPELLPPARTPCGAGISPNCVGRPRGPTSIST